MIFDLKKKKQRQSKKSSDSIKVIIKTKRRLSKEQKNTIESIVKKGIEKNDEFSDIAFEIMMATDIDSWIDVTPKSNGIQVTF